jgi:outer membrane lipoprotein-sorting protein
MIPVSRLARIALALVAIGMPTSAVLAQANGQGDGAPKRTRSGGRHGDLPPAVHEARRLLFRMVRADRTVSYAGREVVVAVGRTLEMQVRFDPKRGMRRESVGPTGDLVVDDTKRSWFVSPRSRSVFESESALASLLSRWRDLLRTPFAQLRTERQGEDTVAGRAADILLVAPAEGTPGPSRRFWIDKETGLRLRMEEKDPDGRIVVSAYFMNVNLDPVLSDADFAPPPVPSGFKVVTNPRRSFPTFDEASKAGFTPPTAEWLPAGYRPKQVDVRDNGRWVSAHWGNGLTVVTLTAMKGPSPGGMPELADGAPPQAKSFPRGGRGLVWRRGETRFILMGPLPDDTLKRIAESVR